MKTFLGTILAVIRPMYALFDIGMTHSFISSYIIWRDGINAQESSTPLRISTAIASRVTAKMVVKECPMVIKDTIMPTDLIVLNMSNYNVILRIDWLSRHYINVFCKK